MSHLPDHIKHLDYYDVDKTIYFSDCLSQVNRYLETYTNETGRVRLSQLLHRELHNAVAELHNQGFNGGVERLLAVLAGEKALELTSRGQEVQEMLEDSNLSVNERSRLTVALYYLKFVALYEEAERGLAGVPLDQKEKIILSFQYPVAVSYRKTYNYQHSLSQKRNPDTVRQHNQRARKKKLIGLSEATKARYSHLYSREHRYQQDYIAVLRRLKEQEDAAFVRSDKGYHQIRNSIGGYTSFDLSREVEAIIWGLRDFNLLENSSATASKFHAVIPRVTLLCGSFSSASLLIRIMMVRGR